MKIDRQALEARIDSRIKLLESAMPPPSEREKYIKCIAALDMCRIILDDIEAVASKRR